MTPLTVFLAVVCGGCVVVILVLQVLAELAERRAMQARIDVAVRRVLDAQRRRQ